MKTTLLFLQLLVVYSVSAQLQITRFSFPDSSFWISDVVIDENEQVFVTGDVHYYDPANYAEIHPTPLGVGLVSIDPNKQEVRRKFFPTYPIYYSPYNSLPWIDTFGSKVVLSLQSQFGHQRYHPDSDLTGLSWSYKYGYHLIDKQSLETDTFGILNGYIPYCEKRISIGRFSEGDRFVVFTRELTEDKIESMAIDRSGKILSLHEINLDQFALKVRGNPVVTLKKNNLYELSFLSDSLENNGYDITISFPDSIHSIRLEPFYSTHFFPTDDPDILQGYQLMWHISNNASVKFGLYTTDHEELESWIVGLGRPMSFHPKKNGGYVGTYFKEVPEAGGNRYENYLVDLTEKGQILGTYLFPFGNYDKRIHFRLLDSTSFVGAGEYYSYHNLHLDEPVSGFAFKGSIDDLIPVKTTGTKENPNSSFLLYPNPASETIEVVLEESRAINSTIEIVDPMGRVIKSQGFTKNIQINVADLQTGIYFVRVLSRDRDVAVKSFAKQKI